MKNIKIGYGYDIHKLIKNRKLILGGIEINYDLGLEGHSDGDCLSHAITDAILGACGLFDIGYYFPNTELKLKNINSQLILKDVYSKMILKGYYIGNIDSMIIAEKPNLISYIIKMKNQLSKTLLLDEENISIKTTTNEGLDKIGEGLAIAAHATCLLYKT